MAMQTSTKKKQKNTSIADPATDYARAVEAGKIVAGPMVRLACKRHLLDLEQGKARGLVWDLHAANDVIGYFEDVLYVYTAENDVVPFPVFAWQAFVLGSLFGWKRSDGTPRFRIAYIETGKGSGKTPLLGGIGLYGLTAMGKYGAEIYAAATKKDQAMIMFRDAVRMVKASDALARRLELSGAAGREWNIAYVDKESFFRPISADKGQSGPRVFMGLIDELHEHKDASAMEMMVAGTKANKDALIVAITNSGSDLLSVCGNYHEASARALNAAVYGTPLDFGFDDALFAYVCGLDEGENPLQDESCWEKANPSLQYGLPGYPYLRQQVAAARNMPAKAAFVQRINFCVWTEADSPWLSAQVWKAAEQPYPLEKLRDRDCYGGLDLSATTDLTSYVLEFEPVPEDPVYRLLAWFWLPEEGLQEKEDRDHVPYLAWKEAGHLLTTHGAAIDQMAVIRKCMALSAQYNVKAIGYDRAFIKPMLAMMEREGYSLPLQEFGQGFVSMGPAVNEFERRLISGKLRHDGHPILRWNAASAVIVTDDAGMRKPSKSRARNRIDGIYAALDAVGVSMKKPEQVVHMQGFVDLNQ
jgi:phage terminase large subunit-like protein